MMHCILKLLKAKLKENNVGDIIVHEYFPMANKGTAANFIFVYNPINILIRKKWFLDHIFDPVVLSNIPVFGFKIAFIIVPTS